LKKSENISNFVDNLKENVKEDMNENIKVQRNNRARKKKNKEKEKIDDHINNEIIHQEMKDIIQNNEVTSNTTNEDLKIELSEKNDIMPGSPTIHRIHIKMNNNKSHEGINEQNDEGNDMVEDIRDRIFNKEENEQEEVLMRKMSNKMEEGNENIRLKEYMKRRHNKPSNKELIQVIEVKSNIKVLNKIMLEPPEEVNVDEEVSPLKKTRRSNTKWENRMSRRKKARKIKSLGEEDVLNKKN